MNTTQDIKSIYNHIKTILSSTNNTTQKPTSSKKLKQKINFNKSNINPDDLQKYKLISIKEIQDLLLKHKENLINLSKNDYYLPFRIVDKSVNSKNKSFFLLSQLKKEENPKEFLILLVNNMSIDLDYLFKQSYYLILLLNKNTTFSYSLLEIDISNPLQEDKIETQVKSVFILSLDLGFTTTESTFEHRIVKKFKSIHDFFQVFNEKNCNSNLSSQINIDSFQLYSEFMIYIKNFIYNSYEKSSLLDFSYIDNKTRISLQNKSINLNSHEISLSEKANSKANFLMNQGKVQSSICLYTQALEINPLYINSLSNRAESFLRIGFFFSALADCNLVLSIDSKHLKSLFRKGRALEGIDTYDSIVNAYEIYEGLYNEFYNESNSNNEYILEESYRSLLRIQKKLENKQDSKFIIENMLKEEERLLQMQGISYDSKKNNTKIDYKSISQFRRQVYESEFSSYISSKIEVKESIVNGISKGLGVFATCDIEEGEIILIERPIVFTSDEEIGFILDNIDKISKESKEDHEDKEFLYFKYLKQNIPILETVDYEMLVLYKLGSELGERLSTEGVYLKSTFLPYVFNNQSDSTSTTPIKSQRIKKYDMIIEQLTKQKQANPVQFDEILKIIGNITIQTTRNISQNLKNLFYGVWIMVSLMNHNCLPNCFYFGIGQYLIMKSTSFIRKGEELFINYVHPLPYLNRQESLFSKWGFKCRCQLCLIEEGLFNKSRLIKYDSHFDYDDINIDDLLVKDTINLKINEDIDSIDDVYSTKSVVIYKKCYDRIEEIKSHMANNQIDSYSQLENYSKTVKGKEFLYKIIFWVKEFGINSNKYLYSIKSYIKNDLNQEKKERKAYIYLLYSVYLFYKYCCEIISHINTEEISQIKEVQCYLYRELYDVVKYISIRETYEVLVNYDFYCGDEGFSGIGFNNQFIRCEIKRLYHVLYSLDK